MQKPSNNPVTLPFGATSDPYTAASPHKGVDFGWINSAGQSDKTIYMPEDGTVTLVPNNGNDGNGVYFNNGSHFHGLLHTSQYLVSNGQFASQGTAVAVMGATGAADGVHLHWALKVNGQFVNGLDYVTKEEDMSKSPDLNEDDIKNMLRWAGVDPDTQNSQNYIKTWSDIGDWNKFIYDFQKQPAFQNALRAKFGGTVTRDDVLNYLNGNLK